MLIQVRGPPPRGCGNAYHEWSSRILQIASGAGTELASHASSFEQLRDLERTAPQVLESLAQSRQQLDERPGDVPRTAGEIAPARQHLGWVPRTELDAGLLKQIAWHQALRDGIVAEQPAIDQDDQALRPASA